MSIQRLRRWLVLAPFWVLAVSTNAASPGFEQEVRRLMLEERLDERAAIARVRAAEAVRLGAAKELFTDGQVGRPEDAYAGCDTVIAKAPRISEEEKEVANAGKTDPLTARRFASFSVDDLEGSLDKDEIDECWFRLDGVWREDVNVALDTSFRPEGWVSGRPELVHLANGTYTTPIHIYIEKSKFPEQALRVVPISSRDDPIVYRSTDGVTLKQLLQNRGARKIYNAPRPAPAFGLAQMMVVDVTRTGYLRMRIGATNFYRPAPGTLSKISGDDPFMIGYTMENLRASRTGYDITAQNPNRLLQNPNSEVFDFAFDRGAVIDQRRVVPLGLKLLKEETQGNVFYSSNVSSEREYQRMTRSNFGNSTRIGVSGSAGRNKESGGTGSVNLEAGYGWGSQSAKEQFSSLQRSGSVAEEVGYMRFKKLALVLDPTYARLTDRFIDAIADAQRYGNFSELFRKFGTHYPYAITYGAAGEVRQKITASGYQKIRGSSSSSESNKRGSFLVGETSSYSSKEGRTGSSFKETNEYGERTFDAVGGNGSWDQAGFSAGDAHYPILADLRPLSDLLNPIYFPNQPDVYLDLRRRMDVAIAEYLSARAELSEETLVGGVYIRPPQGPRRFVKYIKYSKGDISYFRTNHSRKVRTDRLRICFKNNTGQPKSMVWTRGQAGVNHMHAPKNGSRTCVNLRPKGRIEWGFRDRGRLMRSEGMNLQGFAGSLVEFIWVRDY